MAIRMMMLLPVMPLLVAGLLTEEIVLLAVSGAKAGYNLVVVSVSEWLERRASSLSVAPE